MKKKTIAKRKKQQDLIEAIRKTNIDEINVVSLMTKKSNPEVRREVIKKVGMDRVVKALGALVLDKRKGYELISLDFGDNQKYLLLKIFYPSVGKWHFEAVPSYCETIKDALSFRKMEDI